MIGQWLGANAPFRFNRLILANTTSYYADKRSWTNSIELVLTNGIKAIVARSMERRFSSAALGSAIIGTARISACRLSDVRSNFSAPGQRPQRVVVYAA